jgi:transposase
MRQCAVFCGATPGESYQVFLSALAQASGIYTPSREDLARPDRKLKKKTSNTDWTHPGDPEAKVAKMKDGRTHLAHKAEHAVDLETGAMIAVTLQDADAGDTTTIIETAIAAAEQIEDAQAGVAEPQTLDEIIADKGYHSNQTMVDLGAVGLRSYIAEPYRGRRDWSGAPRNWTKSSGLKASRTSLKAIAQDDPDPDARSSGK